jgi:hypothetical protein
MRTWSKNRLIIAPPSQLQVCLLCVGVPASSVEITDLYGQSRRKPLTCPGSTAVRVKEQSLNFVIGYAYPLQHEHASEY